MGLLNIKLDEILYIKCLLSACPPPPIKAQYMLDIITTIQSILS